MFRFDRFAPFFAGASLFALDKTKGGVFDVRPIASGEILRRLIAKCLCATHKKLAAKLFVPARQFGVACSSGAERVIYIILGASSTRRLPGSRNARTSELMRIS